MSVQSIKFSARETVCPKNVTVGSCTQLPGEGTGDEVVVICVCAKAGGMVKEDGNKDTPLTKGRKKSKTAIIIKRQRFIPLMTKSWNLQNIDRNHLDKNKSKNR